MTARLRIIGDVHGKRLDYLKLINKANAEGLHTLQIGDLGFGYEYRRLLKDDCIDTTMNKMFMGNHDAYNMTSELEGFSLGDYGPIELNGVALFFVRGAFSIDKQYRTIGLDWFPEEEIQESEFDAIIEAYRTAKPDLVVTHDCPDSIGKEGACFEDGHRHKDDVIKRPEVLHSFGFNPNTFSTRTQVLLERLFRIYKPKKWVFGHYHKNWISYEQGTEFRCLNELSYVDI